MEKIPLSDLKDRLRWIKLNLEKSKEYYWRDSHHYEIPFASFSDYSGCMVERANSRALEERFSFVTLSGGSHGSVETVIEKDNLLDAVFSDDFPEFKEAVDSLHEYPCLDDELLSQMEMEAENAAWKDWIESDFKKAILREHGPQWDAQLTGESDWEHDLETGLDVLSEKETLRLFRDLCDENGQYPEIETGGLVWIDLEKLVESLSYQTLIQVVTGVYFVKPDAIQTDLLKRNP